MAWFETHDTPANITKDDDATQASIIKQFDNPSYHIDRIFLPEFKNHDGIYTFLKCSMKPLHDWKHETYAYTERQPIKVNCITKQGITGEKLQWKMEKELRRVEATYPLGSRRNFSSAEPTNDKIGLWDLNGITYYLDYTRAVEDYTSDVTLSYGAGWEYDGLRLSGGDEGIWLLTDGGNTVQTVTQYPGYLNLVIMVPYVADSYTISGDPVTTNTDLDLSSTIYTKIRFRYRTCYDTTAKVILGYSTYDSGETPVQNVADGDACLIMAETASTTWSIVTASIPTGKTVDHIILYACDGQGYAEYDWIEIYKDNFTFPNVVDLRFTPSSRNVNLGIPSGLVLGTQNLGANPARIELDLDLDMETTTYEWQRSASDRENVDVFLDIIHNQSVDVDWQYLVWGRNPDTPFAWRRGMRVVIDDIPVRNNYGTGTLNMHEYSESNMDDTYRERWNI